MMDHQGQVVLPPVGVRALAPHLVVATQFAMIGRKDHDGVLVHAVAAQRVEQELNLAVAVSYGVK